MSVQVPSRLGNWSLLKSCVKFHLSLKGARHTQVFSHIPLLLWTSRSVTPLLQGPHVLPNKPCIIGFHPEQLNKPCTAMHHHVLPCITMCCNAMPCVAMRCHALPCAAMHYHALPCACLTRSWHCFHDHPPICTGTEFPVPLIDFCSGHYPQCLKASLLAI